MADLATKQTLSESVQAQPSVDESALQAFIGKKKYGDSGMIALQKAGREGASKDKMARIRAQHDKMDESDMEEGNEFSGELVKARASGAKEFKVDGKSYPVREAAKPDYIDLDRDGNRKESMKQAAADKKKKMGEADPMGLEEKKKEPRSKGTAFDPAVAKNMISKDEHPRYDVKDTGYSKRYIRKTEEPEDDDDSKDSQADKYASPKKKGRPTGTKRAIGAKGPTGRSKLMSKDSIKEMDSIALVDKGEYDREGDMAKEQLYTMKMAAQELSSILDDDENLPEWVQSKITLALDYIDTARDYMKSTKADRNMEPVAEKAVSKNQAVAARIARGVQKGDIEAEPGTASAEMAKMRPKELRKFAKTDTKGLPKKVKEQTAEEPKKVKGGFEFGKGVYESMDHKFRQALTEGMNISVNMNTGPDGNPTKNITVSADGDDAEALAMLLKMAGMGTSHDSAQAVDENSPDYPTNTETSDDAFQYSGGLNGPKSTGQTTVPVIASQLRRQVSMEESVELERDLFRLYQNYKAQ